MSSVAATLAPSHATPLPARLRDAAAAAFVAAVLALPFIGLETYSNNNVLDVRTRWDLFLYAVAAVFIGRFLMGVLRDLLRARPIKPTRVMTLERADRPAKLFSYGLLGFALVLPFLPFIDRYWIDLGTTVLIYIMLGWGLNVVVGLAGLLDLGYVAFYAVGAYSYALLAQDLGLGFWICLPLAGVLAATFGVLLGFPVLRLRGDYLAIVTLGFGEIIRIVVLNWQSFTGGPNGIASIPRPSFFGLPFARSGTEGHRSFAEFFGLEYSPDHRLVFQYFLILALALLTNLLVQRLRRLPIGRAWEALREDEIACRSLGINPTNVKLTAFGIGAMLAGFAGSFFATRSGFISPESFTFIESATILGIVVLGGMGSQIGVVMAAIVLTALPELLREFSNFRMLIFGAAMILMMIWRPQGLLSHRSPSVRLGPGETPPAPAAAAHAEQAQ